MSTFELKEIEFAREYRLNGFIFPAGTRCKVWSGTALTLVERKVAKFIQPKRRKNASRLDTRKDSSANDAAAVSG